MNDASASYFAALAALRLEAPLTAERWPQPEDEFGLLMAAATMRRLDARTPQVPA